MWPCLISFSGNFLLYPNNPYNPVGYSKSGWHKSLLQLSGDCSSGIIYLSHNRFSSSHVGSLNLDALLQPLRQLGAGSPSKGGNSVFNTHRQTAMNPSREIHHIQTSVVNGRHMRQRRDFWWH